MIESSMGVVVDFGGCHGLWEVGGVEVCLVGFRGFGLGKMERKVVLSR